MADYYQEILARIEQLMKEEKIQEAFERVSEELSMPYIPYVYQDAFEKLQRELKSSINNSEFKSTILSFDEIEEALLKDELSALEAIQSLKQLHLAPFAQRIQKLLDTGLTKSIESLLILILIEQQVDVVFTINREFRVEFNPLYVEHPADTDGFLLAKETLERLLVKDPSTYQLCEQLLVEEALLMLPLSYDEQEGLNLAYSIIKVVDTISGREELWQSRVIEHGIDEKLLVPLQSRMLSTL